MLFVHPESGKEVWVTVHGHDVGRLGNRILRDAGVEWWLRIFRSSLNKRNQAPHSAYVAGLPVYAQGRTRAQPASAIVRTLRAYLEAHPQEQPRAEVQVAKVSAPTNRFARPTVNLVTAAALVGRRTSVRKAASSRANGRLGGRPRKMVAG